MTTFCIDFYESNLSTVLADSSEFLYFTAYDFTWFVCTDAFLQYNSCWLPEGSSQFLFF
jgi:hypothetical protein